MSKSAKKKTPTIVFLGEEEDGDVIFPTAPESRTQEIGHEAAIPAEKRERDVDSSLLLTGEGWRKRNARLQDLLSAAAELVAQLSVAAPAEDAAARGHRAGSLTVAIGQAWELVELQSGKVAAIFPAVSGSPNSATILSTGRETLPAKFNLPSASHPEVPSLQKRLPFVRDICGCGGRLDGFSAPFRRCLRPRGMVQ
ncbi:unnamed protein product [Lampetra planeri]